MLIGPHNPPLQAREKEKEAKVAGRSSSTEASSSSSSSSKKSSSSSKKKSSIDPLISALASSSSSSSHSKRGGKNAKKNAAMERYAELPDDVSDPSYSAPKSSNKKKNGGGGSGSGGSGSSSSRSSSNSRSGGGGNSGSGTSADGGGGGGGEGGSRGAEFPTWACAPGRIQQASKIVRPINTALKDTEGRPIHAHGGGFLAPGQGGGAHKRWWWYGESAKAQPHSAGVNAYSSSVSQWCRCGLRLRKKGGEDEDTDE